MDIEKLLKERIKSSDGMYKLFTDRIGGCWVLAQALKKYIGEGDLYTVVDGGEVKLIVLKVGSTFINAGGVRDASKLLKDLKKGRGYADPHLRSFKATDIPEPYPTNELIDRVIGYFKDGKDITKTKSKPKPEPEPKSKKVTNITDAIKKVVKKKK